jgi:hypothetical protein
VRLSHSWYPASPLYRAQACYIRAVPKPPPRFKVQRAKVIVTDADVKRLTVCESCGEEKYIAEGEGVCDECKSHGGLVLVNRKRKPKS